MACSCAPPIPGRTLSTTAPITPRPRARWIPTSSRTNSTPERSAAAPTSMFVTALFSLTSGRSPSSAIKRESKATSLAAGPFASVNQFQSGLPFTVITGSVAGIPNANMDGNTVSGLDNSRPNCAVGGSFTMGNPASNTKYVPVLLGNNGNCGRNTARLNKFINFDWTASPRTYASSKEDCSTPAPGTLNTARICSTRSTIRISRFQAPIS